MKIIEFLASQLDRETTQYDNSRVFIEEMDFWNLCLECRRLLIDEKLVKQEDKKDAANIG